MVLSHGAYRECGILPGEEMVLAISKESIISRDYIPSGKQVRRAREKQLITVFREAMSRVASRLRRVYRADDMRHKSGRDNAVCGCVLCGAYGNLLRPTRLPTRKRRSNVSNPIRTSDDLQDKQFISM